MLSFYWQVSQVSYLLTYYKGALCSVEGIHVDDAGMSMSIL